MRTVCEDAGLALIALGVGLVYLPAGVIVAGLLIVLAANLHADVWQRLRRSPTCGCGHAEAEHQADQPRLCLVCRCVMFTPAESDAAPHADLEIGSDVERFVS